MLGVWDFRDSLKGKGYLKRTLLEGVSGELASERRYVFRVRCSLAEARSTATVEYDCLS